MASSAQASTTLDELPARPPTPPRESLPDKKAPMKASDGRPFDPRLSLHTPPGANTPSSTGATNSGSTSRRSRKKVEWSSHTEYKDPPDYRDISRFFRSSPITTPSASSSRPAKGILKPSPSPNPLASPLNGQVNGLSKRAGIAEMLDSTIKQLAGPDRDSRLDAYMMLSRALKASNNLPDRVALQNKMSLFMSFIERDIKSKNEKGTPDSSLVNHALSLLTTFLHFPAIASTLTSDFGVFIIDHCIRCFSDPALAKDLARHLMQVVAFQSFSSKVMSSDRVGRLITSLHSIEDHLTGKSIVMGRIQIYKRLIKQSRNHMAVHTDWLEDMFTDMLSTIRDIRAQAIALGTEASFALRNEKLVMRKVTEILQASDNEKVYIEFYMSKLDSMLRDKQNSSTVPQIWGVVSLFLQCPISRWQYFKPWFEIAQNSFNSTDAQTKHEANYAWNKYVYLSITSNKMSPKSLGTLAQPLMSQLRRKIGSKQPEEAVKLRKIVMGGICNLYYYAFRPNHDVLWMDAAWDLILQPVMEQLINVDAELGLTNDPATQASRIVAGLLDTSTPRSWKDDRIRDMPLISPEELPSIDSRWTRRNSERIFKVVGPILEKKFNDLANTESLAYRLWQALVGSVAVASSKDIKVNDETVRFIAQSFDLLSKIWSQGVPEASESSGKRFLLSVQHYVDLLLRNLGPLVFTEKRLSMSLANTFEPASTSGSRLDRMDKLNSTAQTPLFHLFNMLCSKPTGLDDNEDLAECFLAVFEPFFHEKPTGARVELSREMLRLLPRDTLSTYGPWILAAQNIRSLLDQSPVSSSSHPPSSERLLGPEYREIVSLLERGLVSHPLLPEEQWFSLFNLLSSHIVQECGDAGRALGLVEPLAKVVTDNFFEGSERSNGMALSVAVALFKVAKLPRDRQAVEAARRRLWGAPPTASRSPSFDPFQYLYQLQSESMKFFYETETDCDNEKMAAYFQAVDAFIAGSFSQNGIKTLSKLQTGLVPWIQDDKAHKILRNDSPVSEPVRALWDSICAQLLTLGRLEDKDINTLEPLIAAGFKSKHRHNVNKMAETWNALVKNEDNLDCSESLKSIIASLRPMVDVSFPGMEESSGEFGAQAQNFIDSQEDLSFVALSSAKSSGQGAEHAASPALSISKMSLRGPVTRKRRRDATPESVKTKSAKRTTTPRLRHDNSQIQFAPIVSSPLVEESQHLTERQREIRQRQQENAGLYPGIRSSPRTRSQGAKEKSMEPEAQKPRNGETTPERPGSYDEFITLTPTPRRGSALHLEGFNDPPSSPPDPRRNPLLSEIQTRSKARDSIESWQFSSPPGSPAVSQQATEVQPEAQTPSRNASSKSTRSKRRRRRNEPSRKEEIIPSSLADQDMVMEEDVSVLPEAPQTQDVDEMEEDNAQLPPHDTTNNSPQVESPPRHSQETAKSGDDEFVDAKTSPGDVPCDKTNETAGKTALSQNHESSFALSEGDESSLMRFVVELESRRCQLPFDKFNSVSTSPEKKNGVSPEKCIEVQGESSSEGEQGPTTQPSLPAIVPSTPADAGSENSESQDTNLTGSKRKRKRSGVFAETRSKKRRPAVPSGQEHGEDSQPTSQETVSPVPTVRRSSRRNAGQKGKDLRNREVQASPSKKSKRSSVVQAPLTTSNPTDTRDDGDTDEELMSQLVTESHAASQSQEPELEIPDEVIEESAEVMSVDDELPEEAQTRDQEQDAPEEVPERHEEEEQEPAEAAKPVSIVDTLRGGLQQLRVAALSREEVYQLEDMLMDMKRELFEAERRGRH